MTVTSGPPRAPVAAPPFAWIGCVDASVSPELILGGSRPALELACIGCLIDPDGDIPRRLERAIAEQGIELVLVCGHRDCLAARTAIDRNAPPLLTARLGWLRAVADRHRDELDALPAGDERAARLVELATLDARDAIAALPAVVASRDGGSGVTVHAVVLDDRTGLLTPLG